MNKIAILGSGSMSTAVAKAMHRAGNKNITIYGIDEKEIKDLENGKNTKYFPVTVNIPKFKTTNNLEESLKGADIIFICVPSNVVDKIVIQLQKYISKDCIIGNFSKGFYPNTNKFLHNGLVDEFKNNKFVSSIVTLTGPSHAEELILEIPTFISAISENKNDAIKIIEVLTCEYLFINYENDIKGAEVGSAYKNILAIASGIAEGLGYGINTKSAIISKGFSEMVKFNDFVGGKLKTISGLTGLGDLIVTATSSLSRNFNFGVQVAKDVDRALETSNTVEGLIALNFVHKIASENKLNLPIVDILFKIIYENNDAETIINKGFL